ncbi:hypothetical protein SDC9_164101 [bioreactor metagenome]|uniref:Uncharacterized protein n=1 Tax=bioreactor metagenome TaxID=1076179 RepID=A0A645FSR0_9ZZZZ
MFKIFMMLAIAAPGIILAIVLSSLSVVIVSATVTSFAAISLINFPIALGVMFLCRDMLQYAEING